MAWKLEEVTVLAGVWDMTGNCDGLGGIDPVRGIDPENGEVEPPARERDEYASERHARMPGPPQLFPSPSTLGFGLHTYTCQIAYFYVDLE